jgi:hypothetical protein
MLTDFERASFVEIDPPPEAAGFRASPAPVEEAFDAVGSESPDAEDETPEPPAGGRR